MKERERFAESQLKDAFHMIVKEIRKLNNLGFGFYPSEHECARARMAPIVVHSSELPADDV
jgi:hypothetical protein